MDDFKVWGHGLLRRWSRCGRDVGVMGGEGWGRTGEGMRDSVIPVDGREAVE